MDIVRVKVLIDGRVQGVSFRYYAQRRAAELELTGFVRNLSDGRVEVVFEGEKAAAAAMLKWCESGPPSARVDSLAVRYEEPEGRFSGFNVRH